MQLTNHIQHQLAEAGRDANPISAMFDSLTHPQLDTHRGEFPTFLEWRQSLSSDAPTTSTDIIKDSYSGILDIPSHTPIHNNSQGQGVQSSTPSSPSTFRPHIVLGRGDVGGIWADMGDDHTQTLR